MFFEPSHFNWRLNSKVFAIYHISHICSFLFFQINLNIYISISLYFIRRDDNLIIFNCIFFNIINFWYYESLTYFYYSLIFTVNILIHLLLFLFSIIIYEIDNMQMRRYILMHYLFWQYNRKIFWVVECLNRSFEQNIRFHCIWRSLKIIL